MGEAEGVRILQSYVGSGSLRGAQEGAAKDLMVYKIAEGLGGCGQLWPEGEDREWGERQMAGHLGQPLEGHRAHHCGGAQGGQREGWLDVEKVWCRPEGQHHQILCSSGTEVGLLHAECLRWALVPEQAEVIEYLVQRMEEPCGKSVPQTIYAAIAFMELSAAVPTERRLVGKPALANFFREAQSSGQWNSQKRISARRWPVVIPMGLEFVVITEEAPVYKRIFAWYKLVKLWGALRWDDTLGCPPASFRWIETQGLEGEIVRSKTSGDGKRAESQKFFISVHSYLVNEGWLKKGLRLFWKAGSEADLDLRDFMMPKPDAKLTGFSNGILKYGDAMAMSRALLSELPDLQSPGVDVDSMIDPLVTAFWTEHTERVTMITWAASLGVDKEVRQRWGRWRPTVDEDYAKSTGVMVRDAQKFIAESIRSHHGFQDVLNDLEVLMDLKDWMVEKDLHPSAIEDQLTALHPVRTMTAKAQVRADGFLEKIIWKSDPLREVGYQGPMKEPRPIEVDEEVPTPTSLILDEVPKKQVEKEAGGEAEEYPNGTFVMSVVGRSKRRTLHQVGACYRRPGRDYKSFLVVGNFRPTLEAGEKACATCFGRRDKAVEELAEAKDLSETSDSSSTDLEYSECEP